MDAQINSLEVMPPLFDMNAFHSRTHKKADKSESTIYKYYPRPKNRPVGKTISGTGNDVGVDANIKLWASKPIILETVYDIKKELEVSAKENVMWTFDGPNEALLDVDSNGEVWTKDEHGSKIECIGGSVNGEFQHVRRKAYSKCGRPKKIFQLDIDDLVCPSGINPISVEAVEYAVSLLPEPLNGASWAYQFSSKAGVKGNIIKLHLFGVMDFAVTNDQKEEWLKQNTDESKLKLDYSFYDNVRPIYIKDPLFKDGAIDPFIANSTPRIGIVKGKHDVIPAEDIATVTILPAITGVASSGIRYSRGQSVDNSLKLFDKGKCCEGVIHATKNMVVLHGRALDKERAIKDIQAVAEDAMKRGTLRRSSNRTHLDYSNLLNLINGAIAKGFDGQLIEIPDKIKRKSKTAQFKWAMSQIVTKETPIQDIVLTALSLSFGLVGVNFSHQEALDYIFKTFSSSVPREMESWMRNRANWRMRYAVSEVMPLLDITPVGKKKVEHKRIKALNEVKLEKGAIIMVKAGMGTGKTSVLGKRLRNKAKGNMLAVSPRRSLVREISNVLKLQHYMDEREDDSKGYAVCVDSIQKFSASGAKADIIFMDEISQTLESVMTSSVMQRKHKVYDEVKRLINTTDYVVCLDAGICDKDIEAMQRITNKKIIVYVLPEDGANAKDVTIITAQKGKKSILPSLAAGSGEPFVFCSDNKKHIKAMHKYFKKKGLKGICVTSDSKNIALLSDINGYIKKHKPDYLLYSPAIS